MSEHLLRGLGSVLIVSMLMIRSRMVSMLTIGGVGPATGPNENGGPADKFFLRKFPALPNLAPTPNAAKFAAAVHTDGNRKDKRCSVSFLTAIGYHRAHGADGGSDHVD